MATTSGVRDAISTSPAKVEVSFFTAADLIMNGTIIRKCAFRGNLILVPVSDIVTLKYSYNVSS